MSKKKIPTDLEYFIPHNLMEYASWDYIQTMPLYDPRLFNVLVQKYGLPFVQTKKWSISTPIKNYFNYIKFDTDHFKQLSIDFETFKDNNPWVEEFYNFCLSKATYVTDPFDLEGHWIDLRSNHNNSATEVQRSKRALEFFKEKIDYARFNLICGRAYSSLLFFNEIKRDVPFVVGNIVRLRKKCIDSKNHDPFYYKPQLRNEERVGHITAILDDTHRNSYNGKGSRLVEVYWAASGETNKQSINSLKLFDQKNNKMVDKIVDT